MGTTSVRSVTCIVFVTIFSLLEGVRGYECPSDYPFRNCPRPDDPSDYTVCCKVNGYPQCCDTTVIAAWAIWVVVVTCLLLLAVVSLIICACCPCCWLASRRRRAQYVVVSSDAPVYPAPSTTRTTYVYTQGYNAPQPPTYNSATAPPLPAPVPSTMTTTTYVKQ